jgi:hypothetical protein
MGVFFILILIEMIKIKFASFLKLGLLTYAVIIIIACNSKVENQIVPKPQPKKIF